MYFQKAGKDMKISSSDRKQYFKSTNEKFSMKFVKDGKEKFLQEGQLQWEFCSWKERWGSTQFEKRE